MDEKTKDLGVFNAFDEAGNIVDKITIGYEPLNFINW